MTDHQVVEQPISGTITFGSRVSDLITGFEGVVTTRHFLLQGTVQWGVCGKVDKPGGTSNSLCLDPERLSYIDGECEHLAAITMDAYDHDALGKQVENVNNGFTGIVTEIIEQINGCVWFAVQDKFRPGDETSGMGYRADHKFWKITGVGISAESDTPMPRSLTGCCLTEGRV